MRIERRENFTEHQGLRFIHFSHPIFPHRTFSSHLRLKRVAVHEKMVEKREEKKRTLSSCVALVE